MTIKAIIVKINTEDEAMVGAEGWNEYDASTSTDQFLANVRSELATEYPGVEIDVEGGSPFRTIIDVVRDDDENPGPDASAVQEIISCVWERFDWFVA